MAVINTAMTMICGVVIKTARGLIGTRLKAEG